MPKTAGPGPEWIETASQSDVGRVRERNEDHFGELSLPDGRALLVLADGMGGHRGGAHASQLACEATTSWVGAAGPASLSDPEGLLVAALSFANESVFTKAAQDPTLLGMGTTLVAALLTPAATGGAQAAIAHVGDSRAYLGRDGTLDALTEDHSVVAALVRQGVLDEAQAAIHPRRNEILRSVGSEPEVEVDVQRIELRAGDRLLLCSDGLCGVLDHEELSAACFGRPAAEAAKHLVDAANQAGGPDNITVQIADVLR